MRKELKDITEEDIKTAAKEAGFVVSWMNAKYPVGLYAYMLKYCEVDSEEPTDHYLRTSYEVSSGLYEDLKDFVDECRNECRSETDPPAVFKYYNHYVKDGRLYIRFTTFSGKWHGREQTPEQIKESLTHPSCHSNQKDVLHFYDI